MMIVTYNTKKKAAKLLEIFDEIYIYLFRTWKITKSSFKYFWYLWKRDNMFITVYSYRLFTVG